MTRWLTSALLSLACSVAPAHAQQEGTLGLADVLASVETHHPLISAELASVQAADGDVLAARGEFDTQLSVQGRIGAAGYYDPKRIDVLLEQPTPFWGTSVYAGYRLGRGNIASYYGEQRTLSGGELRAGVRVPVLQDGAIDARRAGVRSANAQRAAAELGYRRFQLDLQRDATSAYYAWAAAGQRMRVLDALVRLAEHRDGQISEKVTLGALPSIESIDNHRSVLERRRQLVSARRSFEKASIDLSLFVRDATGAPRVLGEAEVARLPELSPLTDAEAAAARALRQRPELAQLEAMIDAMVVERELSQNRIQPRLDGFAEVSQDFGHSTSAIEPTLAPTVVEVGALVSVPLWLRKARGKLRAVDAKLESSRQKLAFARDRVLADVRDAWSQWSAALERVEMAQQSADAADLVASGERERFELGASTILFVNLREQTAADARMALIDAQAEAAFAALRARLVTGESLARP